MKGYLEVLITTINCCKDPRLKSLRMNQDRQLTEGFKEQNRKALIPMTTDWERYSKVFRMLTEEIS